jgi:hypothetical protein
MRTMLWMLAMLLLAMPVAAQEHFDTVVQVRRDLTARGIIPAGIVNLDNHNPCGVFEITKRVAWLLKDEGAGLLEKTSGNNCQGYSMDFVVYADGRSADIAVGGVFDGVATDAAPAWGIEVIPSHVGRWRAPFDPGEAPLPNPGTNLPNPGTPTAPIDVSQLATKEDVLRIEAKLDVHEAREAEFRDAVRSQWKRIGGFLLTKVAPIIGGILAGVFGS